jgi:hypothetical protein
MTSQKRDANRLQTIWKLHLGYNVFEVGAGSQGIGHDLKGKTFTEVDSDYEDCSGSTNDLHPAINKYADSLKR